jgi:potassium-transporting ATPase KdpC subunit
VTHVHSLASVIRQHVAALRILLVLTVLLGVAYPLAITAVAQLPGLAHQADGSTVSRGGRVVGSSLIGQSFTNANGDALVQYFQSRPSAAGTGYDPTASSASNLGPESVVDTLPDPSAPKDSAAAVGKPSLLTQVCQRSVAIGKQDGVSGARPFCTSDGVGAVLAVFYAKPSYQGAVSRVVSLDQPCPATPFLATYRGVRVECATYGADYAAGQVVPIRGDAPATPAVPSDAVTSSGSGLDPDISPAYARLQETRVARARGVTVEQVARAVASHEADRELGFLGEPVVNVVELNLALDATYPYRK